MPLIDPTPSYHPSVPTCVLCGQPVLTGYQGGKVNIFELPSTSFSPKSNEDAWDFIQTYRAMKAMATELGAGTERPSFVKIDYEHPLCLECFEKSIGPILDLVKEWESTHGKQQQQ